MGSVRIVKKLTPLMVGLWLAACLVLLIPASFAVAQTVEVGIDTPTEVNYGESFTATIDISGVVDFDAADFELTFDSSILKIEDTSVGADIHNGMIATTTIPVVITNVVSEGVVKVVVNISGNPGVTGSGHLCEIRFHVIGGTDSSTDIGLQNGTLGNNNGEYIPAIWGGSTVHISEVDTTPPTVMGKAPIDFDISVDSDIKIAFSKPMNKASVEDAFSILPGVVGSFSWEGNTMIFSPEVKLKYATQYRVCIAASATDLANNALEGDDATTEGLPSADYCWTFQSAKKAIPVAEVTSGLSTATIAGISVGLVVVIVVILLLVRKRRGHN